MAAEVEKIAYIIESEPPLQIDVRRTHVLEDSMREAKKKKFTVFKKLQTSIIWVVLCYLFLMPFQMMVFYAGNLIYILWENL